MVGMEPGWYVGADVGGTKIAVMVVDEAGQVRSRLSAPTDVSHPEATLAGIATALRQAVAVAGVEWSAIAAVGVGIPGQVNPQTGEVRLAVNLNLREIALGPRLEALLKVPCFLENDVRAAALGLLHHHYRGQTVSNLAYLSVGTGISAGVILQGNLYRGATGMAGEVGHIVVERDGALCACGLRGCLETVATGPSIARRGQEALATGRSTLLRHDARLTAEILYEAARAGDPIARRVADEVGSYLAQALHQLIMAYDVERLVVGGGVAQAGDPFWQPIRRALERQRQASPLAHTMLAPEKFHLLPPDSLVGQWGAITLARLGRLRGQSNGHAKEVHRYQAAC